MQIYTQLQLVLVYTIRCPDASKSAHENPRLSYSLYGGWAVDTTRALPPTRALPRGWPSPLSRTTRASPAMAVPSTAELGGVRHDDTANTRRQAG